MRLYIYPKILHLQEMNCSIHSGFLLREDPIVFIKWSLILYHGHPVHFQIFLRVAEETSVDAEPELQAESPHRQMPSAVQRGERQHTEEPETGLHQHSQM